MHLTVAMTSKCNLDCTYCSAAHIMAASNDKRDLIEDVFAIIEKQNNDPTLEDVEGIGWLGGEPLLEKRRLFDNIRRVKETYPNIKHSINTNGYYLDKTTVDFCNENEISVVMSLDGIRTGERSLQRLIRESRVGYEIIPNLCELNSVWFRVVVDTMENFSERVIDILHTFSHMDNTLIEIALDTNREHELTPDEVMNVVYEFRQTRTEMERMNQTMKNGRDISLHTFDFNIECDCTVHKTLSAEGEVGTHAKYTRQDAANMGIPYGCIDTAVRFGIQQYNVLSAIVSGELRK